MTRHARTTLAVIAASTLGSSLLLAQTVTHQTHGASDSMKRHLGAQVMGFDQDRAAHHFYLHEDGGAIDIVAKDAKDEVVAAAIRTHLQKLTRDFGAGDFAMPHEIHAPVVHAADHRPVTHGATHGARGDMSALFVPGGAKLSQLKAELRYTFSSTAAGGRVDIRTTNAEALKALHEFLRYQITEHFTGDSSEISARK